MKYGNILLSGSATGTSFQYWKRNIETKRNRDGILISGDKIKI